MSTTSRSTTSPAAPRTPELPAGHTVNMADVAARAGVSLATVSRALRDVGGVSESTRRRVRQIADELSYVVSPEASALARRETGRVAVVVPKLDVWFYATMLAGIETVLRSADLDVLIYQVDGESQRRRFFTDLPARRKVDALVLIALPLRAEEERRLDLLGVQVVVAGGRVHDYPFVETDDTAAATTAMNHLVELGHTRIAMIRTSDTDEAARSSDLLRCAAYRAALEAHGLPFREEWFVTMPFGPEAGSDAVARLMALPEPPTAVFAYSDEIAVAARGALLAEGVPVPGEVSLIGVDGHPTTAALGLTTVDQDVLGQGRTAGQMTLDLMRGHVLSQPGVVVPPRLVRRGSTGPVPVRA